MTKSKIPKLVSPDHEPRRKIPKEALPSDEEELSPPVCNLNKNTIPGTPRSPSPTRSITPEYMNEDQSLYSQAVTNIPLPESDTESNTVHRRTITESRRPVHCYQDNKRRSAILWLENNIHPADLATEIAKSLKTTPENALVGLQKDTRVKSSNKYIIVFKEGEFFDDVLHSGVTIQGRRIRLRELKPRPPPRKRAFLPNFPVAASASELAEALVTIGLEPISIQARTIPKSNIKIGGWSVYVNPKSEEPRTVTFDETEYAIVWGRRKSTRPDSDQQSKDTANPADNNETVDTADKSNISENNKVPTNDTTAVETAESTGSKTSSETPGAPVAGTTENTTEEREFQLVENKKNKDKKKGKKNTKLHQDARSSKQEKQNQQALNEQLRDIPRKERMIRHNGPLSSYEPEPYQVIYTGFPEDTTISGMRNYISSHGIFPVRSQLLSCPRSGPTILVSFADTESALVQSILANSEDRLFYEHADDTGHAITARGHFGRNVDVLQAKYDDLIGKS